MPRLYLLAKDNIHLPCILLADQRKDRSVDCVEHLCAVGADIVEVEFEGVWCAWRRSRGRELGAAEFGRECHRYVVIGKLKVVLCIKLK